jgi:outer membrane protein assembly factor BamD
MKKDKLVRWIRMSVLVLMNITVMGCAPQPKAEKAPLNASTTKVEDEAYVTFRNTHENSPKIPGMIVRLAKRHIAAKEYLLARFYCDEYRRDYPSGPKRDEIEYLRVKAGILHAEAQQDDRMMQQAEAEAKQFLSIFRRSPYRKKVQALLTDMRTRQNARYEELAKYYEKKGKPKAAAFYREKIR